MKNKWKKYASDLTDSQWEVIAPLFPPAGNKSKWEKREWVDAVLYLVDNGCQWRNLSHDFPLNTTVSNFYYAAVKSGLCEKLLTALVQHTRKYAGHTAQPGDAIVDSQSVKTTGAAQERGIDDGKKQKDTIGTAPKEYGITPSMSRWGNCYNNAMAENFVKTECIYRYFPATFSEGRVLINHYIYFYNHQRIQLKTHGPADTVPLHLRSHWFNRYIVFFEEG